MTVRLDARPRMRNRECQRLKWRHCRSNMNCSAPSDDRLKSLVLTTRSGTCSLGCCAASCMDHKPALKHASTVHTGQTRTLVQGQARAITYAARGTLRHGSRPLQCACGWQSDEVGIGQISESTAAPWWTPKRLPATLNITVPCLQPGGRMPTLAGPGCHAMIDRT